ncbi:hypothetical protein [Bacillus sp. FJAT-45350]|uniref:hypothetical protein n=1 Tax=Bacillus sp. FJAT-45350 TaxID=2011014 RepID=UPI000BB78254|nr:hypothetical protein [Bacillus sp. FJAT-45350]
MKWLKYIVVGILFSIILTGCQVSMDEALVGASEKFYESFSLEKIEPNEELDQINFYLPRGMNLEEEEEYNIVLDKGGQIFLLFYNPSVPLDSDLNLERDKEFEQESYLFEVVEEEGKLGYLIVSSDETEDMKLIVGLGGTKLTTLTSIEALEESTTLATEILHSIEFK